MAEQITSDYAGKNLHLIGVLKGACVFLSDLMRSIDLPLSLDFIGISSYGASTKSSVPEMPMLLRRNAKFSGRWTLI